MAKKPLDAEKLKTDALAYAKVVLRGVPFPTDPDQFEELMQTILVQLAMAWTSGYLARVVEK